MSATCALCVGGIDLFTHPIRRIAHLTPFEIEGETLYFNGDVGVCCAPGRDIFARKRMRNLCWHQMLAKLDCGVQELDSY